MDLHPLFAHLANTETPRVLDNDASQDLETQSAIHQSLLRGIFMGLDGVDDPNKYWIRDVAHSQIARVHALASRGVSLARGHESEATEGLGSSNSHQVAHLCDLVRTRWSAALTPALELVLRTYVEQGLMDLEITTVPNSRRGNGTYLEAALSSSNAAAVPILMEMGSRLEMVPARDFTVDLNGQFHEVAAGDFEHFMEVMYGKGAEHTVRVAVGEGLRRLQAMAMKAAMQEVTQAGGAEAVVMRRRRARL